MMDMISSNAAKPSILSEGFSFRGEISAKGAIHVEGSLNGQVQVDELTISNAKINLSMTILGGKSATVPLPDIKLTNLGQGADGVTPAEVIKVVLKEVMTKTTSAVGGFLSGAGKAVTDAAKNVGGAAADAAKGITKGIGDMFKKKE